jgi:cell division protein FtsZ
MSLMEVNEALTVIQEAAHEEANIIFGAVVDPTLGGRVKITVIATGFDRAGSSRNAPAAPMQTPVDLHSYTTHLAAKGSPAAEPAAASRLTIARRPALDLPFNPARAVRPPAAAASAGSRAPESQAEDQDLNLELDVPAFLRRSEG